MKIGFKFSLGFGAICALIVILSLFSLLRLDDISMVVKEQNQLRNEKLERLYIVREALGQTGLSARNAFIYTDDAQANRELDLLDQQKATYLGALNELVPLFHGDVQFEKARQGLISMAEELKKPRQFRSAAKMEEFGKFLVNECSPLRRQIVTDIDAVVKSIQQVAVTGSEEAEERVGYAQVIILVTAGIALLLSVTTGIVLTRGLLKQLGGEPSDLCMIASRIADGDLTARIDVTPGDQSSIMYAMHEMQDSLIRIVSDVRAGTDLLGTAVNEIAAGNMSLSSRTEEQAASLEETAASMEELTSTVRQNADNALQASTLAAKASDVAQKGGAVVAEVVETMGSINASSQRIVDIIGVIDGIAFQTNILALNAAVEAARAGEQGRGFAVVATEVRNLAQRSAAAAKEIKSLIDDSVDKVETGTRLVASAGTTMDEVVNSVQRVTDIISEITAASQEQSAGIDQMNQAISQMDQATQQNAALVEETAAAADAMQGQSRTLSTAVGAFKVDTVARATSNVATRTLTTSRVGHGTLAQPSKQKALSVRKTVLAQNDGWEEF